MPRFEILLVYFSLLLQFAYGEIAVGSQYGQPYTPTACYGQDRSIFPTEDRFAAIGENLWDNGAACGRDYKVRCISGPQSTRCKDTSLSIQVRIVDRALTSVSRPSLETANIVLSSKAFAALAADPSLPFINIELVQV